MSTLRAHRTGRVARFDAHEGLGQIVEAGPTGRSWPFHCTQIADGSRLIEPGTAVTFGLLAGRAGRIEATAITPA